MFVTAHVRRIIRGALAVIYGFVVTLSLGWHGNVAYAQMTIEGSGGDTRPFVVALPKVVGDESTQSGKLQELLIEDFRLSGMMSTVGENDNVNPAKPELATWAGKKADFLVVGSVGPDPTATSDAALYKRVAKIRIFDVVRATELEGLMIHYDNRQLAIAVHQMADTIILRMTGIKVGLSQLVAMVVKNGRQYDIRVSDILGKNSHSILRSMNPIISPTWSPDGKKIAYASFENGPSQVFIQDVASGERTAINTNFESASAPAWSPDGKKIAFAAYARQKTSIYEYDVVSRAISPLVQEGSINTEPAYGFDGYLYFSSNRGASPQIYRMNLANRQVERFSFDENYCTRPSAAMNQPVVAYLNRQGRGVTISDGRAQSTTALKIPNDADGLALSPQGRLILVSVAQGNRFQTIITNTRGSYSRRIDFGETNYYEPAWRP